MSKRSILSRGVPKCEDDYRLLLRQFRLDLLLQRISETARNLYKRLGQEGYHGYEWEQLVVPDPQTKNAFQHSFVVAPWWLVDLAYAAVKYSNDYHGTDDISYDEFKLLILANLNIQNKNYKTLRNSEKWRKEDVYLHVTGILGEQFLMQKPGGITESSTRDLYILLELSKNAKGLEHLAQSVVDEAGTSWLNVVTTLLLLWSFEVSGIPITETETFINWDDSFTREHYLTVLKKYTITYEEVRESPLGRQSIVLKPYIKTSRNDLICVSCFLLDQLSEHAIMWLIRDNYKNKGENFSDVFGLLFERYLEEVFAEYLESENYERIAESKTSRADWKLSLCGQVFLIEQKSSLLGLPARQQETSIEAMRIFVNRNIVKGLRQLKTTEDELGLGTCVKIVLLYEGFLKFDLLEFVVPESGLSNDGHFWLVTINEMEMLLHLYREDRNMFEAIVKEKTRRQTQNSYDGCSLDQLFQEREITENKHLSQDKFERYHNLSVAEIEKRLDDIKEFSMHPAELPEG